MGVDRQFFDGLLHGHHQQMPGQIIQKNDTQKKQAAPHQVHDHVPDCSQCGPSNLTYDQDAAAGQRQDLQEHISREDVIGPCHRHESRSQQIQQAEIQILLALIDIFV